MWRAFQQSAISINYGSPRALSYDFKDIRGETLQMNVDLLKRKWLETIRGPVARGAIGSFAIHIINQGLVLMTAMFLASILQASSYGVYSYARACLGLLSIPAALGFGVFTVRELAVLVKHEQWQLVRGLLVRLNFVVLASSISISLIVGILISVIDTGIGPGLQVGVYFALAVLPLEALLIVREAATRGFHRAVLSQVPVRLARPLLFFGLVVVSAKLLEREASAAGVLSLLLVATACSLILASYFLHRAAPREAYQVPPLYRTGTWIRQSVPFSYSSGVVALGNFLDVILLGVLLGPKEVGQYAVAKSFAGAVLLPRIAVNYPLAPQIASLFSVRDMASIEVAARMGSRASLLLALPLFLIFLFFGEALLFFVGEEFSHAALALLILACAMIIAAAGGTLEMLLLMTGHPKQVTLAAAAGIVVSTFLLVLLTPRFGIDGAATAAAGGIVSRTALSFVFVRAKLGVNGIAF